MEFHVIVKSRRSARNFTGEHVDNKDIEKILYSASLAPSAKNRQPWKFYVLSDEQKQYIMNMLFEWDKQNRKERTSVKGTAEQIEVADKMIMIYSDTKKEPYKKPDYISLGCAIENMSLEAVNLGLGSCILCDTLYIDKEIDDYLGVQDLEQICGFIIGKPIYNYPKKARKDLKELLIN